jgi:hypothetical protein
LAALVKVNICVSEGLALWVRVGLGDIVYLTYSVFSATLLLSITALFREPKAREDLQLDYNLSISYMSVYLHADPPSSQAVLLAARSTETANASGLPVSASSGR